MINHIVLNFVVVIFILMSPIISLADKISKNKTKEPVTVQLEDVVVTATKTQEKRQDTPNSITLIDQADIQNSPARSLGDLLSNEPGIDFRTYGNFGGAAEEIKIRGMDANGTQVLVNGLTINSPSLGSADVSQIPLNSIERIEVVKGAGSLLYGSGAMGGTINIFTKRPTRDEIDLKAWISYGTQQTYQLSVKNGMFINGSDFGYYITADQLETDGFRDNSDLTHKDVSLNLVFEKKDALDISLYGDYIDRKFGIPGVKPPEGTHDYYKNGVRFYSSESASVLNHGSDGNGHLVLQANMNPLEWLGLKLRGDYFNLENFFYNRNNNDGTGNETWITNRMLGAEGILGIKPFDGADLIIGSDYKDYVIIF